MARQSRSGFARSAHRAASFAFLMTIFGTWATPAMAGTICGMIRDARTNQPVARALVLLRTPTGSYTGYNTGSDLAGNYCLSSVAPGTYDLEVRVDSYAVFYQRNVVVTGSSSGVDLNLPAPPIRLAPPTPNPAVRSVVMGFELSTATRARLTIFDARGRLVQGWDTGTESAGGLIEWDLRDRNGVRVPGGVYFVVLDAGSDRRTTRLVVARG